MIVERFFPGIGSESNEVKSVPVKVEDISELSDKYQVGAKITREDLEDVLRILFPGGSGEDNTKPPLTKGVVAVGSPKMWDQDLTGKDVLVGVIDTGIANHPDLQNVVIRRIYTGETGEPRNSHGTHVAGTIAANGGLKGVAFNAMLADYRVLDNEGSGSFDAIVSAVYDAVRDGCDVINMSLGGRFNYPPLRAAINYAFNSGVVVVVAAGNSGDGLNYTSEYDYPAMYPTVVSVGSSDYRDGRVNYSNFSNSNYEVDCCSQGERVLSCGLNDDYDLLSGTSMASPHIAGVVALLVQQNRKNNLTVLGFHEALYALCKDVYRVGKDNTTGNGFATFNDTL